MSVIFDQLDNIQSLRFRFTQAIKLGVSLYYIENCTLKRLVVTDNQIESYNESEALNVLSNVSQICSDSKTLFCLQSNGDLYQIDQQPKLLVSGKNYMNITPTTAIDHSGRGFFWKNNKPIYSHCKHISAYQDKMTLITIGGKIFNIENGSQIPIQQLNGLGVNGYFKKSLLFQFGGIAITENGDAYCYNTKMIKLKTSNLEDIQASSRFVFGIQGKYILQWNLEDFQNHQFFVNQTLFKKMNYGHEIQINCKKKEFQEVKFIFADQFSQFCCASIQSISKQNQNEQSISAIERTFCRSTVQNLKQQLFDQWDPPSKKKTQEVRQNKYLRGERTERSETSNRQTDRIEKVDDPTIQSKEQRYRQQSNNILDALFEKSNKQDNVVKQQVEKDKELQINPNFNFKTSQQKKSEIFAPLEISKLNLNDKTSPLDTQSQQKQINQQHQAQELELPYQQQQNSEIQFEQQQQQQKQQLGLQENQRNKNAEQQQLNENKIESSNQKQKQEQEQQQKLEQQQKQEQEQQLKLQQQKLEEQQKYQQLQQQKLELKQKLEQQQKDEENQQLKQLNSMNMPKQCQEETKQSSKLLEQYKKQFDQILKQSYEQIIEQSIDHSKETEDLRTTKQINQESIIVQQNTISQKLQSIREIYEQPKFKTQNNSLYTLDEENSVEQSVCQEEDEKDKVQLKRQALLIQDIFNSMPATQQGLKKQESVKQQCYSKDFQSPSLSLENSVQLVQASAAELQLPPIQSSLNTFFSKLQLKPEKSIDQVLKSQTQKDETSEEIPQTNSTEQSSQMEIKQTKIIKSFLKPEQCQKQKNTVEVMEQQSAIDYQNNSGFIDQQHDSFMQILQTEKKQQESKKIQNILSIFDQIQIEPKKRSPHRINLFKKQDQENRIKKIDIISDSDGQLDENLTEIKHILKEKNEQIIEKKQSPNKTNIKLHKTLVTFSEDISQVEVQERVMQVVKVDQNLQTVQHKHSPIKKKSPVKENNISSNKNHTLQSSEQKNLTKISQNADVKQPNFDIKISANKADRKYTSSQTRIQTLNCNAVRPEKIFTPLRSRRNSTARGSSVDTTRFKQLQIETQIVVPDAQNQTPQINNFEALDLSNAMYHINQTLIEDSTKNTPVAQVFDVLNINQQSQQKLLKEPQLIRVSSSSQIPPSLRTNSVGPTTKKTEVSPMKVSKQTKNASSSKSVNDETIKLKKRQQDIILRKLFFRLDIHVKIIKLEFMFNMKQRTRK
ncbi:unnamed protein product (macronuclear) [Paramecium tetraurelia]|uniref:Uncharacterized protein n=1 Tax=Paramecium tetraurelia TaxID=5888 RepID=A0D572_PARTE|nr:uncharacterized protein GSPATT00013636001 [Paramecium tetraurelia]CAK78189.1 unnamed protein product [Paramecium tetraurelia]|eukprot:XP_001445586.1 hypothetical protein (macronuclear) [Paramecium tetraurelia strain d4-2]